MAHELPIIASDIEANKEFIEKKLVFSFENKNHLDLLNKMKYFIYHPIEIKSKTESTAKYIAENFSWRLISNQIENVYQNLLKK